jgi:hypothetical protein
MLKKTLAVLIIAGSTGSAGMEIGAQSAAAITLAGHIPVAKSSSYVQPAAWVYVPSKNGARYRIKRPGYSYYHGGWWYSRPWWTIGVGPVVVAPVAPVVVYNPAIHGPRYVTRRPGFVYHHGGYWYRRRWW